MNVLALVFVRARWLFVIFIVTMTALAIWGYSGRWRINMLRGAPETRADAETKAATENDTEVEEQPIDPLESEQVTQSFNLDRADAFLVLQCDDLFQPAAARAIRAMVQAVEELPLVDTVFWLDDVPLVNVFGIADPLMPEDDASADSFREARQQVLNHPLARGQLISPDGGTLMMPLVYNWLYLRENEELTAGVAEVARQALATSVNQLGADSARPDFQVRITGDVPLFVAQENAFRRNEFIFRAIGYSLAFVLSVIMFRGVAAVLIVSLAPMLGLFWTFGLMNLVDVKLNPLANVVMPLLVSMIGLTDGVHLMVHIRRTRAAGASPLEAARRGLEKIGPACFLTSLTTAIGFASLLTARSGYIQDFGRECMWGVLVAFLSVVTFIPLLSSTRWGLNIHQGHERDLVGQGVMQLRGVIEWIIRHKRLVSATSIVLTLMLAALASTLRPDSRISNGMPATSEAYQALAHCDEVFGGIEFVQVRIAWPTAVSEEAPEILAAVRAAEELVQAEPLLQHPLSVRNMLASFPGDPDDLTTQMTFLSLLPRDLRSFFFRPADRETIMVVRIQDRGIGRYVPVFRQLATDLRGLSADHPGFQFSLGGEPVRRGEELYEIVMDLSVSLLTASLVILLVLAVVYRSIRLGLISVVPNLFPLVATAGLLVITGRSLNLAAVCAFVVCLGIAVDDTIHFLSRYRLELAVDGDTNAAIVRTFEGVGTALVMTTIILVAGFSAMLVSDLPAHQTFAAMACATIGSAVVGDLIALPALLSTFRARGSGDAGIQ